MEDMLNVTVSVWRLHNAYCL